MKIWHELHELHDFFVFLQTIRNEIRRFRESLRQVATGASFGS
jgi:hypothetical protein